jgi:hypothetical protein
MGLRDAFNHGFKTEKVSDSVLSVTIGYVSHEYDFLNRVALTFYNGHIISTPFAQVDRETLIAMRDKLVELKGNPPDLPAETPVSATPAKKFNL